MRNDLMKGMVIGGFCIMGGFILKELKEIKAELEYFERGQGIYSNRKEYEKQQHEYWKKRMEEES